MGRRLKLVIEYDGAAYVGWERQKNGLAIQEVLEDALFRLTGERIDVEGSGRTDAGVHALGQVASLAMEREFHPRKLLLALNAVTPKDIAIRSVEEVPPDFHARFNAKSKLYRYSLLLSPSPRPLLRATTYHVPRPLDLDAMRVAARELEGTHDFRAFAREANRKRSCVRTILSAVLREEGDLLHVELEGTGFLYNMVRIVVGTLIEIGLGRRSSESVPELLRSGQRVDTGYTVPAHGLVLVEVRY